MAWGRRIAISDLGQLDDSLFAPRDERQKPLLIQAPLLPLPHTCLVLKLQDQFLCQGEELESTVDLLCEDSSRHLECSCLISLLSPTPRAWTGLQDEDGGGNDTVQGKGLPPMHHCREDAATMS